MVLRVEGLRKSFGGRVVLDGVDLQLRRGEVVLLEGENGSGKTTLLNILTGNLEPDAGTIRCSANESVTEFKFPQPWWQSFNLTHRFAPDTVARSGFGRTWQDVRLFESLSLHDNIAVGQVQPNENPLRALFRLRDSCTKVADGRKECSLPVEMLAKLGLAGRERSSGDMISLGQSKRVAIARTVAAGAKVLFLDEPLAGLDRNGIEDVLSIMRSLILDHEITIVIIEHVFNQHFLKQIITTHWHLSDGHLTAQNPKENKVRTRQEPNHLSWIDIISNVAETTAIESLPRGAELKRFCLNKRQKTHQLLEISGLLVKRGNRTVLGLNDDGQEVGLNLSIAEGEIVVLQAPNGWGKSSLVAALSGIGGDVSGNASIDGVSLLGLPAWERASIGLTTVVSTGQLFNALTNVEMQQFAARTRQDFSPREMMSGAALSGGQRSLFALDLALQRKSRILVLDEPFNGMDSIAIQSCIHRLLHTREETILVLTPKAF